VEAFAEPFFEVHVGFIEGAFNFSTLVFLLGGGFIMYTASGSRRRPLRS
jgi:hypothetical protein